MRGIWGSGVVAIALLATGCGGPSMEASKADQPIEQTVFTVAERSVPDFRMVSAVLTNRDIGDARARIGGCRGSGGCK